MFFKLLSPFTALMSRLKYAQKFVVVSFLFLIPLVLLLVLWVNEQEGNIEYIQSEHDGVAYIREMMPLMLQVQQHRGLSSGLLNGNADAKAEVDAKSQEIASLIQTIDTELVASGMAGAQELWEAWKQQWTKLDASNATMSAAESFEGHSTLVLDLTNIMIKLADESGLSLDTQMDSYYLGSMFVQQIPALMEHAAIIRGKGNGVLTSKKMTENEEIKLRLEAEMINYSLTNMNKSLSSALGWNEALVPSLEKSGATTVTSLKSFVALLNTGVLNGSNLTMNGSEFFKSGTATIGVLNDFYVQVNTELEQVLQQRIDELTATRNMLLGLTALSLLLVAIFYMAFYRNVMVTVAALRNRADAMAKGDFSKELHLETRDELLQVGHSFNEMIRSLNVLLRRNQIVSEQAAASSEELTAISHESTLAMKQIAESIQGVSEGTDVQRVSADETSKAMNEMAVGITRIAEAASEVADAAVKVTGNAQVGEEQLGQTVRQMNSIQASAVRSGEVVTKLDEHSVQIGQIVQAVMAIAKQTQLLSLNANIEAARAGEHGRGFSVVASEVGKLAEQTSESVQTISELIRDIRALVSENVKAMSEMKSETASGLASIEQANTTIGDILLEVRSMSDQIQEVSAAAEEISAGMEEVTASVGEVANISNKTSDEAETMAAATEEQLASMEEIQASAEALRDMAQQLQDDLSHFVLSSEDTEQAKAV
ncbi:hypothetical protein BBD42_02990 [Paenibacillus sp. BIHB 4019]|uniref:Chemotaxis protein n=1 Tax=Paenibacillus sp. BIHB 4019 TaxID=1870819 RepID=A0A1B2DCV5_9BACL|nr:methyl-accepting chemotaxis protein [Paenibacillus sp. BIHB 4019]ANY65543.1 hypothetical protein BBD42_02990 [Paenibacillus sp. BIHB 4019]